ELETDFVVLRDGKKVTIPDVKPFVRVKDNEGNEYDRYCFYVEPEKKTIFGVVRHGFFEAVSYVRTTVLGLADLLTGRVGIEGLGGVIKVGEVVGKAAKFGIENIIYIMALISVNLGVMNLLPIPALDGGRIVLLAIEGIMRKPVNEKVETALVGVSMILLLLLMFFVMIKDIITLL
ncbi:MAG: site-2 protease family protein, partial [Oscillospiraceae bacterium]|nr:site-2 protease family protein [Oscillospiraceae bacterium]